MIYNITKERKKMVGCLLKGSLYLLRSDISLSNNKNIYPISLKNINHYRLIATYQ